MTYKERMQIQDTICNMVKGINSEAALRKLLTYVNHAYIVCNEGGDEK